MKRFGKLLAILLAVTMVFGMLPAFASAEGAAAAPVVVAEQTAQTAPAPAAAPAAETPAAPEKEATLEPMASAATKIVNALKVAATSDPGNADLKVSGADGNTYWFATATATNLGHALALAAGCSDKAYNEYNDWKDNPGTITLLKDVDIECSASKIFEMSNETKYNNGQGVTIDLDEHTLKITNDTDAYLIAWERYKLTIKDGTLIYINNGGSKGVFFTGTESGSMSASTLWTNTITLTDLNIYVPYSVGAEYAHTVFTSYAWPMVFNITNCVLLSEGGKVLDIHATDFETKAGTTVPSKSTVATITVTNSVLGSISSTFEEPVISDIIAVQGDYTLGKAGAAKSGYSALDGIKIYEGTKINIDADSELVYNTTDAAVIGTEEASCLTSSASVTDDGTYSVPEEACFLGGKGPEQEYEASYTSADGQTTTEFGTLTEAIKASQSDTTATTTKGGWVTLLKDASVGASEMNGGSSNTVYGGTAIKKALNIDLNKHTLTNTSTANLFYFRNNTVTTISLTLKNGTILQNGGRRVISYASDFGGTANDTNELYLTLKDLTIECSPTSNAQGFFNIKGSKGIIDIDGCTFINAGSDGNAVVQLLTDTASVFDQKFTVSVKNSVFDLTKCKNAAGPAFLTIGNCNESATRDNSITIDDASRFYYKATHTTTDPLDLKNNSDGSSPLHIGEKASLVENPNDTYNETPCKSFGYYEDLAPVVATYTPLVGGDPQEFTSFPAAVAASQADESADNMLGGTIKLLADVDTTNIATLWNGEETAGNNLFAGTFLQKAIDIDLNGFTWTDSSKRNVFYISLKSDPNLHVSISNGKLVKGGNRGFVQICGTSGNQDEGVFAPVISFTGVDVLVDQDGAGADVISVPAFLLSSACKATITFEDCNIAIATKVPSSGGGYPSFMNLYRGTTTQYASTPVITLKNTNVAQLNGAAPILLTAAAGAAFCPIVNVDGSSSFYISKTLAEEPVASKATTPFNKLDAEDDNGVTFNLVAGTAALPISTTSDEESFAIEGLLDSVGDLHKIAYTEVALKRPVMVSVGETEAYFFEDMKQAIGTFGFAVASLSTEGAVTVTLQEDVAMVSDPESTGNTWIGLHAYSGSDFVPQVTVDLKGKTWSSDDATKAMFSWNTGNSKKLLGGKLILKNGTIRSAGENGIAYVSTENQGNYEIYGGLDAQGVTFESTSTTAPYLFKVYGHGTDLDASSLAFTFTGCGFVTPEANENVVAFAALAGNNVKDGAMTVNFTACDFGSGVSPCFMGKAVLELLSHTRANLDASTLTTIDPGKILEGFVDTGSSDISFNKSAEIQEGEEKSASLTMENTISLNISIPNAYVHTPFTYKIIRSDGTESGFTTAYTDSFGKVQIKDNGNSDLVLAAQDMRDRIYGFAVVDGVVQTISYSVLDYCKEIMNYQNEDQEEAAANLRDLAKATMNYGYFADMYFNLFQKKNEFATPEEYDQAVAELRAEYPEFEVTDEQIAEKLNNNEFEPDEDQKFVGSSAVLLDTLTIRFYFDGDLHDQAASYTIDGEDTVYDPVVKTADSQLGTKTYTYVEVPMSATDANKTILVTLGDYTARDNIASYVNRSQTNDSVDQTVKDTLKAVGIYAASAITYFENPIESADN